MVSFEPATPMFQRLGVCVLAALASSLPCSAIAIDEQAINYSVKLCVAQVHLQNDEPSQRFDAFYNPATGRVENNAVYDADQEPLYRFEKCMDLHGLR
jgi:hypothetical protein